MSKINPFKGSWKIIQMDEWEQEFVDLLGDGFFEFNAEGQGRLRFIAVQGFLEYLEDEVDPNAPLHFVWYGTDDGDPINGRGWVSLVGAKKLVGHIYMQMRMHSGFKADRMR